MGRFDERTPLWDYSDNSNYDPRASSDRQWDRGRAEQAARRYVAAGEPVRDREQPRRTSRYRDDDDRTGRGDAPYADGRSSRVEAFDDHGQDTPGFWPSEFGYPPSRGYSPYGGRVRPASDEDERGFLERAGDELRSWFGDRDARRRREVDHRGRGPKNYARSDERICDDINDRLTEDMWIDASEIEVSVSAGEVQLTGTVDDRWTKRRAEDCAESVSGVRHVQNNLRYDAVAQTGRDAG